MKTRKRVVLTIFGTRPEAIKLAPVLLELRKYKKRITNVVCVTGQHRQMLDQVMDLFKISADYDLDLMRRNQSLERLASSVLLSLGRVYNKLRPDMVVVQGDTSSAVYASIAAFYRRIPITHVEAGLRTFDKFAPFPEEVNRQIITKVADLHFAPTEVAKKNLLKDGIPPRSIFVTGNTAIDALLIAAKTKETPRYRKIMRKVKPSSKLILVTGHRRESFGVPFENIFTALKMIVANHSEVEIIFPVHMNPNVATLAQQYLGDSTRIHLIEPVDYGVMVHLMKRSYFILTDSGGIQEEAPALDRPVLVLREVTERPEILKTGAGMLVGTDVKKIVRKTEDVLRNRRGIYGRMARAKNPYGDGTAARVIARKVVEYVERKKEK